MAFGLATLATRAVANAGSIPGMASSRLLASLDRCQAMIRRSNSRQLGADGSETNLCNLRHALVLGEGGS
jgi:hypothetical protein